MSLWNKVFAVKAIKAAIWVFGILLSGLPLLASIVSTPAEFGEVFDLPSYNPHYGEIIFISIAVGAVAIAEGLELFIDLIKKNREFLYGVTLVLILLMFLEVIFCAIWYGSSVKLQAAGDVVATDAIQATLVLVLVIVFEALALKLILWSQD